MKIDFHVHPNISKKIKTTKEYIIFQDAKVKQILRKVGIDGIIYTDHIHHPDFWKTQKFIPYGNKDIIRIPGAEISTSCKKDTLVFGPLKKIKNLDKSFPKKLSEGFKPQLRELSAATGKLGLKLISAHHLRKIRQIEEEDYKYFDALELDIRNPENNEKIMNIASRHNLPVVAGSDAHVAYGVGLAWTEVKNIDPLELQGCRPQSKDTETLKKLYKKNRELKKKIVDLEQRTK